MDSLDSLAFTSEGRAPPVPVSRIARLGSFLRHFVEMVIAMMIGMAIFGGVRAALDPTGFADVLREHLDARYLAMAGFMAVPMIVLMRYRGHGWARTAEMVGAMVVPVGAACLLWRFGLGAVIPWLSDAALGTSSHVAMYVGMLLAMLYRFGDYGHAGPHVHGTLSTTRGTPGDWLKRTLHRRSHAQKHA